MMRREFLRKAQRLRGFLPSQMRRNSLKLAKFPVFSQQIREFAPESGSHRTAPSAKIKGFSALNMSFILRRKP
jgi:hypothetical protein